MTGEVESAMTCPKRPSDVYLAITPSRLNEDASACTAPTLNGRIVDAR